jgi:TPR repeat protein
MLFSASVWASPVEALAGTPAGRDASASPIEAPSLLVEHANRLEHGEGVPKDREAAARLYCEAARAGDREGQFRLGWMHANGRGIPRNNRVAASLFALAAQQGHEHAQRMAAFVGKDRGELPDCMVGQEENDVPVAAPHSTLAENKLYAPSAASGSDSQSAMEPLPTWEFKSPERREVVDLVNRLAPLYKVEPGLALAIIQAESDFDPRAVSPKNAQGLMQLLPETAERFGVRNTFDPAQNVRGGLAYLRWLLAYFRGSVALVAAAYNSGEGTVERYRGVPPFPETQSYVRKISKYYPRQFHRFDTGAATPSAWRDAVSVRLDALGLTR